MFEKKTMSDHIYHEVKEAIVFLEYEPGEKLSEVQLAKKYNVSRSPVRAALANLERDGLVVIKPQSGTIVSEISFKRAQDMQQIRCLLEPHAVQMAAPQITDRQLEDLQMHFDKLARLPPKSEGKRLFVTEVDMLMHDVILECCGNKEIERIIKSFRPIMQRVNDANTHRQSRLISTEKEMREIFENLKKRDAQGAYEAMVNHMSNTLIKPTKLDKIKED